MFDFDNYDNYCMNLVYEIETARHRVTDDRAIEQDSRLPTTVGFRPLVFACNILAGLVALLLPKAG